MDWSMLILTALLSFFTGIASSLLIQIYGSKWIQDWIVEKRNKDKIIGIEYKNQYNFIDEVDEGDVLRKIKRKTNGRIKNRTVGFKLDSIEGSFLITETDDKSLDYKKYGLLEIRKNTEYRYIDKYLKDIESIEDKIQKAITEEQKSREHRQYIFKKVNPFGLEKGKRLEGSIVDSDLRFRANDEKLSVVVSQMMSSKELEWVKNRLFTN